MSRGPIWPGSDSCLWYFCIGSKTSKTVAMYKIYGVFSCLHAVNVHVSRHGSEPQNLMTSYGAWALYELKVWRQLEITVHPWWIMVSCLIHTEFLFLRLFCLAACQLLWLGTNAYEISLGHLSLSLEKQKTVCWVKGNDCSEVGHDCLQSPPPPLSTVQRSFQGAVPDKRWFSGAGSLCDS